MNQCKYCNVETSYLEDNEIYRCENCNNTVCYKHAIGTYDDTQTADKCECCFEDNE